MEIASTSKQSSANEGGNVEGEIEQRYSPPPSNDKGCQATVQMVDKECNTVSFYISYEAEGNGQTQPTYSCIFSSPGHAKGFAS